MKLVLFSLSLLPLAASADSEVLCGKVGSHIVAPQCAPNQICPHWRRLQYDLAIDSTHKVDLDTSKPELLQTFGEKNGQSACFNGEAQRDGSFLVDSLKDQ